MYKESILISTLPTVISELVQEMCRKKYSICEIDTMRRVWNELLNYSTLHQNETYDESFSHAFLQERYQESLLVRDSMYKITRAMNMLSDYAHFHVIFKQGTSPKTSFSDGYQKLFNEFLVSESKRGLSKSTMKLYSSRLLRFHDYLVDIKVSSFSEIKQEQINTYIYSFARYSTTYTSESLRMLKRLSDFAFKNNYSNFSFADSIPHVKNIRQQKIPSTFTIEEINKILSSVDKSNPTGMRNYAIFLLAARLALRSGDIMSLRFSNLDWDKKQITLTQHKTHKQITLPLFDDVGWAIINYLQHGRPESLSDCIFVAHRYPYEQLTTISSIIPKQMRAAGINTPINKRVGMHAFRHGLASSMLENDIPLPIISQTLGHADINSTEVYLRVSIKQLSMCGLEVDL